MSDKKLRINTNKIKKGRALIETNLIHSCLNISNLEAPEH